jgi:tartronate-semialdehyde synthase
MAKMRAIDAAVRILEKEGVVTAFGVPGAAINPLYSALKARGSIRHILARHVEGASHMAEGYSRAKAGNIGVCIGTSGPAGTDMITGLYSAIADSVPILCITGQAPRARLYKEDFQAVDIEQIAKPVTKLAVTVREPALVPRVFSQAFHIMRSGRPRPVLIDLPLDAQLAEIEFDDETYASLPVYKPMATRKQIERALEMLNAADRPLIVAGGGIINADASELLVTFAETINVPVVPTLMGWGAIPDDHVLMAGMVGLQTSHRYGNATFLESDFVLGIGNRWANRILVRSRLTPRAGRSCTSTSNRRRLAGCSTPISASYQTPRERSNYSWRSRENGGKLAGSGSGSPGQRHAVIASERCCGEAISTMCRSRRSASITR